MHLALFLPSCSSINIQIEQRKAREIWINLRACLAFCHRLSLSSRSPAAQRGDQLAVEECCIYTWKRGRRGPGWLKTSQFMSYLPHSQWTLQRFTHNYGFRNMLSWLLWLFCVTNAAWRYDKCWRCIYVLLKGTLAFAHKQRVVDVKKWKYSQSVKRTGSAVSVWERWRDGESKKEKWKSVRGKMKCEQRINLSAYSPLFSTLFQDRVMLCFN